VYIYRHFREIYIIYRIVNLLVLVECVIQFTKHGIKNAIVYYDIK